MAAFCKGNQWEILEAYSTCTGVPISVYRPDGTVEKEFQIDKKICKFFAVSHQDSECSQSRIFSMNLASQLEEPYVYYCPSGLVHIAVPLVTESGYRGCVVAGPLAVEESDERLLEKAASLSNTASLPLTRAAVFITKMPRYTTEQVQKLSVLLYSALIKDRREEHDLVQIAARHKRQLDTNAQLNESKWCGEPILTKVPASVELEQTLLRLTREGRREEAVACLKVYIQELLGGEGMSTDDVKERIIWLFGEMAHSVFRDEGALQKVMGEDNGLFRVSGVGTSPEDIYAWAKNVITLFAVEIFGENRELSGITAQALLYITAHYMEKVTLKTLARRLFVSENYLSKLFRQEMQTSFTEYLSRMRIERSVELLRDSELSLLEIAGVVGFEDQSYFTKVFKRITGETPKQYKVRLQDSRPEEK